MLIDQSRARQPLLDAITAQVFTNPVAARMQCLSLLQQARHAFDTPVFIAAALQLSLIEDQLGDFAQAIDVLVEALAFADEFKQPQAKPALLEQLGCCHYSLARYPQALAYWLQCVQWCGDDAAMGKTHALALIGLGRICDACDENALAVKLHQAGHDLLLPSNDAFLITMAKINWAVNLQRLQQNEAAQTLLTATLAQSLAHDLPHHAAECMFRLAQIALAQGELDAAERLIEDALMTIASTPYHWVEINLLAEWAELCALRAQHAQALEIIKRALLIAQQDGLRQLEMRLAGQAHRYALALGQPVLAEEYTRRLSFLQLHVHAELPLSAGLDLAALNALVTEV